MDWAWGYTDFVTMIAKCVKEIITVTHQHKSVYAQMQSVYFIWRCQSKAFRFMP